MDRSTHDFVVEVRLDRMFATTCPVYLILDGLYRPLACTTNDIQKHNTQSSAKDALPGPVRVLQLVKKSISMFTGKFASVGCRVWAPLVLLGITIAPV